jgi:hypothetical protein
MSPMAEIAKGYACEIDERVLDQMVVSYPPIRTI